MSVVLLSGGIDSLVCAELHKDSLRACVFIDYGHPAQIPEGWKAFAYCGNRGITLKAVHAFGLNLGDMATAAGARVVPNRNAVLLSIAANAATALGATRLVIGCNADDWLEYSDCRGPFLDHMSQALGLDVVAPLIDKSKSEVIALAKSFGLSQSDAWSCYAAGPTACGECPSCTASEEAWA